MTSNSPKEAPGTATAHAVHAPLSADHARLDSLLARSVRDDGTVDAATFDQFRADLTRFDAGGVPGLPSGARTMDYQNIYTNHANEYDALVQAEDADGNLIPAIDAIRPLSGAAVLEVGIGTGRIARAVIAKVGRLVGVDRAPAMLEIARRHLEAIPDAAPWELHCADARELPVPSGWADIAVAGWVFGHLRYWMPENWREQISQALQEMRRALRPGGALIVIETLGTGTEEPRPPSPELAQYFAWLESDQHLARQSLRTDYLFPDVETAAATTGSFFGDDFAARVRRERWLRVPECTGLWWSATPPGAL